MPKKNSNKKKSYKKKSSVPAYSRIDIARFRTFADVAASTAATTLTVTRFDLSPGSMGTRAVQYADLFQLYRVVGLTIMLDATPGLLGALNPVGLGNVLYMAAIVYKPVTTFSAPASRAEFIDLPHSCWTHDFSPNRLKLHVNKADLLSASPERWYQTSANGSSDILEQVQLSVALATYSRQTSIVASLLSYNMHITVEFKGPVDPADIPLRRMRLDSKDGFDLVTTVTKEIGHESFVKIFKEEKKK